MEVGREQCYMQNGRVLVSLWCLVASYKLKHFPPSVLDPLVVIL